MKQTFAVLVTLLALAACVQQRPAAQPVEPSARMAIAIEYVAVPTMTVYAQPSTDAPIVTTYGISETVSVLKKTRDWSEVRTTDGTGWVQQKDLITGEQQAELDKNPAPRFFTEPVGVPARARGEITLLAKVNTDGEVIDVQTLKNTTGNKKLAEANASALRQARFYPMVQKGLRMTFTYEHKVGY
jgi:TonB family protein